MAKKEEFEFLSSDNKTTIHAVKWVPDSGTYEAVFQITHGMIEYIERYEPFAEYLTENGFLVVGHDHLGHGQSVKTKDDWGYMDESNGSDLMVEDMHKLRMMIQAENQGKSYFMLGHSMGSYMLRKYLTKHGENLNGALIIGTGFVPDKTIAMGIKVCKFIAKFHGWHYRSKFVKNLSFAGPYKQYNMDGSVPENSWLCKDVNIVNHYYSEPRCSYTFTLGGYRCLMETVLYDNQMENIKKMPKDLPILMLSGAKDPVGDLGAGVKKVYDMLKESGIEDLTYKLFEDDRHEILNESDKELVYKEILLFIKNK